MPRKKATPKTEVDLEALIARIEAAEQRAEAAEKKLESLQDEEARLAEREAELDKQAKEMFERQQKNRRDPAKLKALLTPRDPSIIRQLGDGDFIRCVTLKRIGLNDGETSDVKEELDVSKAIAAKLQDAGALKVKL